jgi:sugar phosphate isomerase/epimerase
MTLAMARIGIVPIIFANDDLPEHTPPIDPEILVAEIARLGFTGCQLSRALPSGAALLRRGVRIAEVYAALPCSSSGPASGARDQAFERLYALRRTEGDVLIFSPTT